MSALMTAPDWQGIDVIAIVDYDTAASDLVVTGVSDGDGGRRS